LQVLVRRGKTSEGEREAKQKKEHWDPAKETARGGKRLPIGWGVECHEKLEVNESKGQGEMLDESHSAREKRPENCTTTVPTPRGGHPDGDIFENGVGKKKKEERKRSLKTPGRKDNPDEKRKAKKNEKSVTGGVTSQNTVMQTAAKKQKKEEKRGGEGGKKGAEDYAKAWSKKKNGPGTQNLIGYTFGIGA